MLLCDINIKSEIPMITFTYKLKRVVTKIERQWPIFVSKTRDFLQTGVLRVGMTAWADFRFIFFVSFDAYRLVTVAMDTKFKWHFVVLVSHILPFGDILFSI